METELYKARSLSSCMKTAYDTFFTNIKTIFRRTWLPALVTSVLCALSMVMLYNNAFITTAGGSFSMSDLVLTIVAGVILLLGVAASVWFDAVIISLLNGRSMKANLPRVIRLALLIFVLVIIVSAVSSALSFIPVAMSGKKVTEEAMLLSTVVSMAVYIIFIIAFLPVIYSSMKYLVEPQLKVMSVLGRPYLAGWRHWGYLFMLCLLAAIISSIIYLIVSLPATVINFAVMVSSQGISLGDASGLPGYFRPLAGIAILIATFIMVYVGAWCTIIWYYAYGNIEAKERERKTRETAVAENAEKEAEVDFEEIK